MIMLAVLGVILIALVHMIFYLMAYKGLKDRKLIWSCTKIVQKIVEVPLIVEKIKEVTKTEEKIVELENRYESVKEVDRMIEKEVYLEKFKEAVVNINHIEHVL